MAAVIKRRRIEVLAFETERAVAQPTLMVCPVCHRHGEFLTPRQAGAIAQVKPQSIRRWLHQGKAHGIQTAGGGYRVCSHSLFGPFQLPPLEGVAHEPLQLALTD